MERKPISEIKFHELAGTRKYIYMCYDAGDEGVMVTDQDGLNRCVESLIDKFGDDLTYEVRPGYAIPVAIHGKRYDAAHNAFLNNKSRFCEKYGCE